MFSFEKQQNSLIITFSPIKVYKQTAKWWKALTHKNAEWIKHCGSRELKFIHLTFSLAWMQTIFATSARMKSPADSIFHRLQYFYFYKFRDKLMRQKCNVKSFGFPIANSLIVGGARCKPCLWTKRGDNFTQWNFYVVIALAHCRFNIWLFV